MIKTVAILGASGRIGQALQSRVSAQDMNVRVIDRADYLAWANEDDAKAKLAAMGFGAESLLICAAGIINPKSDAAEIAHINYDIASRACRAARDLGGRAVSLGTVLETLIPEESQNPYVASKSRLQRVAKGSWLHLQLHTVYGGKAPTPFMFAGLMLGALQANTRFSMTPGQQLREYHHADDEAAAILALAHAQEHGCVDVSHGNSIKLCDLASAVFEHFGQSELLGVGDLKSPSVEAYEPVFNRQPLIKTQDFRGAIQAVPEWLAEYL